jgi:hypothetical protein
MYSKLLGSLDDAALAGMALAGIRILHEGSAAPATTAAASYTVVDENCRRVMCVHLGAASASAGDIRFSTTTTAGASSTPLIPQRYAIFYLTQGESISFYNTSTDTITINVVELL